MISVVIPVKDDCRVDETVGKLTRWGLDRKLTLEILVCGRLLPDQVLDQARTVELDPPNKGACVRAGVLASRGAHVLVCDADLPVSLTDIEALLASLQDTDVAVGHRIDAGPSTQAGRPVVRRLASLLYRVALLLVLGIPLSIDPQCGVKAFRASAARQIFRDLQVSGLAYDAEVLARARRQLLTVSSIPVHWRHSSSTINVGADGVRMLCSLINLGFSDACGRFDPPFRSSGNPGFHLSSSVRKHPG